MVQTASSSQVASTSLSSPIRLDFQWVRFLLPLAIGAGFWLLPRPEAVSVEAWHLLAIFVATIVGIIAEPLPMGAVAFFGLIALPLTRTLTLQQALSGFSNPSIWLILCAFFVARGFIKTGLGKRIAFLFLRAFGKHSLGVGYGLLLSDLMMAPAIPSSTARSGGVILPVLRSLSDALGSRPNEASSRRLGEFLTLIAFHAAVITNTMFVTAMAANPLVLALCQDAGVAVTWGSWAIGAIVPGALCLLVLPLLIYWLRKPELQTIEEGPEFAAKNLKEMGPMSSPEWIMLGTFGVLLVLWVGGGAWGIHPTLAAMIGLGLLVLSGVLTWKDVTQEETAWNTLMWFATLVMMASFLSKLGFISWFSGELGGYLGGISWPATLGLLCAFYFYSHYFFASNTAHASAAFAPFLAIALASGAPPLLAGLCLSYINSLCGGLTHYGCGHAPVLYGTGYCPLTTWWRVGAAVCSTNLLLWTGSGLLWWKCLGWW